MYSTHQLMKACSARFDYVNAYPADSARYGIQTLSPQFFGGPPDLVVAGPNVGLNAGATVNIPGTAYVNRYI